MANLPSSHTAIHRISTNTLANLLGRVSPALLNLFAIPIFVEEVGSEGYALIGFFLSLQAALTLLDFGLSMVVTREVARQETPPAQTLRLIQSLYIPLGVLVGGCIVGLSQVIANSWLKRGDMPLSSLRLSVCLMGLIFAVQWPASLYAGVLKGLERQTQENAVRVGAAILRIGGGLIIVVGVDASANALLIAFFFGALMESLGLCALAWRGIGRLRIPGPTQPIRWTDQLKKMKSFGLSFSAISALGMLISYGDKLVLGRVVTLRELGYYTIAFTLTSTILFLPHAICDAILPRLSRLSQDGVTGGQSFRTAIHASTLAGTVVAYPLVAYAPSILHFWIDSDQVAQATGAIVPRLAFGFFLCAIYSPFYTLAIAVGRLAPILRIQVVAVPATLLAVFLSAGSSGVVGAATALLVLHSVLALFYWHVSRKITPADRASIGRYLLFSVPFFLVCALTLPHLGSVSWMIRMPLEILVVSIPISIPLARTLMGARKKGGIESGRD